MPRKYFRRFLPSHESIMRRRWARFLLAGRLHHANLWHLHRRSVAGGVALGLFCGLIPGPLQMISAAVLAVLFRVNLPVALLTTLYTNPLTIVPLYALAWEYGAFILGHRSGISPAHLPLPQMDWGNWTTVLPQWFTALGRPFALGLPLLALTLAVMGYIAVRALWYLAVIWEWRRRAARRAIRGKKMEIAARQMATLAGGCFWCLEAVFEQVRGVERVVSGYTGGTLPNPSYESVCEGDTGHAEAVQISFDPAQVSYEELLAIFFSIHDPTTPNRQGNDIGTQYRSAVFYHDGAQRREAEKMISGLGEMHIWRAPIITEVTAAQAFYPAEEYHQHFFAKHPDQGYCQFTIAPKLVKFREYFTRLVKRP